MIEVKNSGDKLVWKIAEEVKPNTEVLAHEGTEALVICDGTVLNYVRAGERVVVNKKGLFEKKNKEVFEIYGVNTGKQITLKWGTRNAPSYKDAGYGDVVFQVRCYGKCEARIENSQTLFRLMLGSGEALTEESLRAYIIDKLGALASSVVQSVANETCEKSKIEASAPKIAAGMEKAFKKEFADNLGLYIVSSAVLGLTVAGAEDFDEKHKEIVMAKMNTQLAGENKTQAMYGVDVLKGINEAVAKPAAAADIKQLPAEEKKALPPKNFRFCEECGEKLGASAKFCSGCGKRLQ